MKRRVNTVKVIRIVGSNDVGGVFRYFRDDLFYLASEYRAHIRYMKVHNKFMKMCKFMCRLKRLKLQRIKDKSWF